MFYLAPGKHQRTPFAPGFPNPACTPSATRPCLLHERPKTNLVRQIHERDDTSYFLLPSKTYLCIYNSNSWRTAEHSKPGGDKQATTLRPSLPRLSSNSHIPACLKHKKGFLGTQEYIVRAVQASPVKARPLFADGAASIRNLVGCRGSRRIPDGKRLRGTTKPYRTLGASESTNNATKPYRTLGARESTNNAVTRHGLRDWPPHYPTG